MHLGTEASFLIGGVIGILFAIWLNQPHAKLDKINEYDITEEKLQRVAGKTGGSCLYLIALVVIIVVWCAVGPRLLTSTLFTPENVDAMYRNFWNIP